ncbi:MAG: hypothetical protein RTV72_09500 [Candidatus Thorarchaeota archaeon]
MSKDTFDLDSYSSSVSGIDRVIKLVALLHILTGILTIPPLNAMLSFNFFQAPVIVTILAFILVSILALSIPIFIILGWAILTLQTWVWRISVIFNVVCLIIYIIPGIVLVAIMNIILLLLLNGSDVRLALNPIEI